MLQWEIEDLALEILNAEEGDDLDNLLYHKLGVNLEEFSSVVLALLPHTPLVQTAMTNTVCNAFVSKKLPNTILVKKEL